MRLFFGIELPRDVQAALGQLRTDVEKRDYRWVEPGSLHVTLAFLGQQPDERLDALREVGAAAAAASSPGTLHLGHSGTFPARGETRVLWVGLAGDLDKLAALQRSLASGLRQAGFSLEDRPFRPHITLARRREAAHGGAPSGWPPAAFSDRAEFALRQLTLFESRLSPRGPTYLALAQYPLS